MSKIWYCIGPVRIQRVKEVPVMYLQPLNESRADSLPDCAVTAMGRAILRKETAASRGNKWMVQIAIDDASKWECMMSQLQELMRLVNPNARLGLDKERGVLVVTHQFSARSNKGISPPIQLLKRQCSYCTYLLCPNKRNTSTFR